MMLIQESPLKGKKKHSLPVAFILWVVFFGYAVCAALLFQKVLLPMMPSMHAGNGLMGNDAIYFDSIALRLAEQIHLHGWSSWQLYPATGAAGNVAILGALYALFGHDPALIIPVNAAIHALGGVLIFLLARELSSKESIGTYAGVIAGSLFIIFPSALNWYGQIHKDGYAIAGTLLILLTWVRAVRGSHDLRGWFMLLLANFAGVVLVGIVRPYNLKLLLIATLVAWLAIVGLAVMRRQFRHELKLIMFLLASSIMLAGGIGAAASDFTIRKNVINAPPASEAQMGETYAAWNGGGQWQWRDSKWLPNIIERYVELAARTRAGMIDYGIRENAKSMIDQDVTPQSVGEVLAYLPRALQIALFAPFPATWLANLSVPRLVASAEMCVYYLCIPGLLLLLLYNRSRALWLTIYFSFFFLLVNGTTIANMGTLYRLRYAYIFVLMMLGIIGWLTWLDRTGRFKTTGSGS